MQKIDSALLNKTHNILWDFAIQTDHQISACKLDKIITKKNYRRVDFIVPVDDRVKIKENEKRDKYLDLARELASLWNMKVTVIPSVIEGLGTDPHGLKRELEEIIIRAQI